MLHNDKMRASQRSRRAIVKGPKPPVVNLSEAEQQALEKLIKAHSTERQLVPRAHVVLAASQGLNNAQIARELHITTDTARQWRDRWLISNGDSAVIEQLRTAYPSRYGTPVITHVDMAIFQATYFAKCAQCDFCRDWCCWSGVDVSVAEVKRLLAYADGFERLTGIPRANWFDTEFKPDDEFEGASYSRTQVVDDACVFLDRASRGCWIHKFCLDRGMDFHELKPMVSCLFPVTFHAGLLHPAYEVEDNSLICLQSGSNLYSGIRSDLLYYFGHAFVCELDELERSLHAQS